MQEVTQLKKTKEKVSLIINSIIEMIKNSKMPINTSAYFYRIQEKNNFIIYLYLFKLLINSKDYLEMKYLNYFNRFQVEKHCSLERITNIQANNELDLLYKIKDRIQLLEFTYNDEEERIYFKDDKYVNSKWLITLISLLLDNTKNDELKEINICYTIPSKGIAKITDSSEKDQFLREFTYYNIKVKRTDKTKQVRENNILIVKNAAINYLKHLKQFKHGLETEESYFKFRNAFGNYYEIYEFDSLSFKDDQLVIPSKYQGKKVVNIIKGVSVSAITMLVYKKLSRFMKATQNTH